MLSTGLTSCVSFYWQVLLRVSVKLALGVYAIMSLISVVASLLLPIETKGRAMQVCLWVMHIYKQNFLSYTLSVNSHTLANYAFL